MKNEDEFSTPGLLSPFVVVLKYLDKSKLKAKGSALAHSWKSYHGGKIITEELEAAGPIAPTDKKQRATNAHTWHTDSFYTGIGPSPGNGAAHHPRPGPFTILNASWVYECICL